jgi:outer membrane scaffolding protein for murein synthesis (MipA/OmpV family)
LSSFHRRCLVVPVVALFLSGFAATASGQTATASFHDRDCADFNTQAQAQHFFRRHHPNRDPHRLDGDDDGLACEDLP